MVCGSAFPDSKGLKSHMKTHTGEKPYYCEVCWSAFLERSILEKHMSTHTGEKYHMKKTLILDLTNHY